MAYATIVAMGISPRWVAVCTLASLGGGCAGAPQTLDDLDPELRTSTVVATRYEDVALPETGTFSWMPGSRIHEHPAIDRQTVEVGIRKALTEGLHRRGFFAAPGGRGDVFVGFVGALEGSVDDAQVDRLFHQLDAADASGSSREYRRGALVVGIVDRETKRVAWRGSIAVLTNPELPASVREARIEHGIEQLLSQFRRGF